MRLTVFRMVVEYFRLHGHRSPEQITGVRQQQQQQQRRQQQQPQQQRVSSNNSSNSTSGPGPSAADLAPLRLHLLRRFTAAGAQSRAVCDACIKVTSTERNSGFSRHISPIWGEQSL